MEHISPTRSGSEEVPRVFILVYSSPATEAGLAAKTARVDGWSPQQELSGTVKFTSREPLSFEGVQIIFEGERLDSYQERNLTDFAEPQ